MERQLLELALGVLAFCDIATSQHQTSQWTAIGLSEVRGRLYQVIRCADVGGRTVSPVSRVPEAKWARTNRGAR